MLLSECEVFGLVEVFVNSFDGKARPSLIIVPFDTRDPSSFLGKPGTSMEEVDEGWNGTDLVGGPGARVGSFITDFVILGGTELDAFIAIVQRHQVQVSVVRSALTFKDDVALLVADTNFISKENHVWSVGT